MNILLLSNVPPCTNVTGGQVLQKLCGFLPQESIACYYVLPDYLRVDIPDDVRQMAMQRARRPRDAAYRVLPGPFGAVTAYLRESYNRIVATRRLVNDAVRFGRRNKVQAVWCVLEGQTMIRMALPVAKALGVPLYVQVWDPPHYWLNHHKLDRASFAGVLETFDATLRAADGCAAASWAMADEYAKRYGVRAVPVLPCLDPAQAVPPSVAQHAGERFIIGLAGQLYADKEWTALLAALRQVNWTIAGRKVHIRLLGNHAATAATDPAHIENMGLVAQPDAIRLMSECDVLYCPYWFDRKYEEEARLAFPSKLTTFLAAGRPVFFHGPEYASPSRFLQEHEAGVLCHSLDAADIIASLEKLITDGALYQDLTAAGSKVFKQLLTIDHMRESFFRFLRM